MVQPLCQGNFRSVGDICWSLDDTHLPVAMAKHGNVGEVDRVHADGSPSSMEENGGRAVFTWLRTPTRESHVVQRWAIMGTARP